MPRVEISDPVQAIIQTSIADKPLLAVGRARDGAGLLVEVRHRSTNTVATVYASADGDTTIPNPIAAEPATGRIEGWLEQGSYDLHVSAADGSVEAYVQPYEAVSADSLKTVSGAIGVARYDDEEWPDRPTGHDVVLWIGPEEEPPGMLVGDLLLAITELV